MNMNRKAELLEERKKKWNASRDVSAITEQVAKESAHDILLPSNDYANTSGVASNCGSAKKSGVKSSSSASAKETDIFLHRLTDKLTEHIRDEVKKEMQMSIMSVDVRDTVAEKMDSYLEAELSSYTCKICYELMVSPIHSPTLLFPCGHTFCKQCVDTVLSTDNTTHSGNNNNRNNNNGTGGLIGRGGIVCNRGNKGCPYCRVVIESRAANQSLKDLIDQFSRQKSMVSMCTGYVSA